MRYTFFLERPDLWLQFVRGQQILPHSIRTPWKSMILNRRVFCGIVIIFAKTGALVGKERDGEIMSRKLFDHDEEAILAVYGAKVGVRDMRAVTASIRVCRWGMGLIGWWGSSDIFFVDGGTDDDARFKLVFFELVVF